MMMKQMRAFAAAIAAALSLSTAGAQLRVVTTDTNLADIARRVGGTRVTVESLSRGTDDPHHVDPRPSMVVTLARAAVFARVGMDLDMWADAILERCGNRNVQRGGKGYADCSANVKLVEVPTGGLDPSMGDIHAFGNPHYLLDPANGITVAANIAAALIRVDPGHEAEYRSRFTAFADTLRTALGKWQHQLAELKSAPIVVYHRTWAYFTRRFGLTEYAAIEPKPGVPPSPGHIQSLIGRMNANKVRLVLCETFRDRRYPSRISSETGARAVFVPISVGGEPAATGYVALFDLIAQRLAGR